MANEFMIPSHVPPSLVYDIDFFTAPIGKTYPQMEVAQELHGAAPDIF